MKVSAFFLVVLSVLFCACGSDKKEGTKNESGTTTPVVVADSVLSQNFYKRFEGTVADQPVVFQLQRSGQNYDGMYYYTKQGKWLKLSYIGDSSTNNSIYLLEYSASDMSNNGEEQSASLRLNYTNGTLTGTWKSGDRKKSFPVVLKEVYPEGSYRFTTQSYRDSAVAFDGQANSPVARISEWFVSPEQNDATGQWLNLQLRKILDYDTASTATSFGESARAEHEHYLSTYKHEAKELKAGDMEGSFLNYEQMRNIYIRYNENGFVILESLYYAYEGGAHGNYGTGMYCLDVVNKKVLTLRDVVTIDSLTLQPILERNFRLQAGIKPNGPLTDILFENHLATTENFYFTSNGIGFIYNPYEVAAYALGTINVFVPYKDLDKYLTTEFKQRIKR